MSPSRVRDAQTGFTLIEVMIAVFVLVVGLAALAMLAAYSMARSTQSKYMALAAVLASEKLEDLNRWPATALAVCVPSASSSVGSLTSDVLQNSTCSGTVSGYINYYDDTSIAMSGNTNCPNSTVGCFAETVASYNTATGTTQYASTYHSPDGAIATSAATSNAPSAVSFHRRWVIEANQPVTGVRRITVLVTLKDLTVQPPVNFRMSIVRP